MTAADEYQRACERVLLGLSWPIEDATEAAQALAADPGVRAAVERGALERALEEAWDKGFYAATSLLANRAFGLADPTNPYRQEPSDGE